MDYVSYNGPLPEPVPYAYGNPTGTFLVEYTPAITSTQLTTTFQITPPTQDNLVTSVTTDQPVYNAGQPVNMTFTETNEGTQPVPIIIGSPEFQVMQNGTVIWETPWDSRTRSRSQAGRRSSQGSRILRQQHGTGFQIKAPGQPHGPIDGFQQFRPQR